MGQTNGILQEIVLASLPNTMGGKKDPMLTAAADEIKRLREALRIAGVRLVILTDRMRGCHEETGKHELLDEAEMFCAEALAELNQ